MVKVTVPVGLRGVGLVTETVAVKVTELRKTEGLTELTSAVAVDPRLTVCVKGADVLAVNVMSPSVPPLYVATMVSFPTGSVEVLTVATPFTSGAEPSGAPFAVKDTVPGGTFEPGILPVTVAVKVTVWPETDGFTELATTVVVAVGDGWNS